MSYAGTVRASQEPSLNVAVLEIIAYDGTVVRPCPDKRTRISIDHGERARRVGQ